MNLNRFGMFRNHGKKLAIIVLAIVMIGALLPRLLPSASAAGSASGSDVVTAADVDKGGVSAAVSPSDDAVSLTDAIEQKTPVLLADDIGTMQISFTTGRSVGSQMPLTVQLDSGTDVYIDWGDGNPVKHAAGDITGTTTGKTIEIYSPSNITGFVCSGNTIQTIDVSKCTELASLDCSHNYLGTLNVTKCTKLTFLDCRDNTISSFSASSCKQLEELHCENNNLTFYDFNNYYHDSVTTITYAPQRLKISGNTGSIVPVDSEVNFYKEREVKGTASVFTWYDAADDSVVTPKTTSSDGDEGIFTFGEEHIGKTLFCKITNPLYPDLTLESYTIEIVSGNFEPQIILTHDLFEPTRLIADIDLRTADEENAQLFVDWGDGNYVEQDRAHYKDKMLFGNYLQGPGPIRIYSTQPITYYEHGSEALISAEVKNCPSLTDLILDCGLQELEITNCPNIKTLNVMGNLLDGLDLSGLPNLEKLYCAVNMGYDENGDYVIGGITELDLSNCPKLKELACFLTPLTSLDVSCCPELQVLMCENSMLTEVNAEGCTELEYVTCENNSLRFSTLKMESTPAEFSAHPQAEVEIPATVGAGNVLDLSAEYEFDGNVTEYKWYNAADDSEVTPVSADGGKFTFADELIGKSLYCVMTNDFYPDLTLTTTEVEIVEALDLQITFTTNKPVGSTLEFNPVLDGEIIVYVDWGDGNIVPYQNGHVTNIVVSGETKGDTVKIYSKNDILFFDCPDCGITDIDLSKNPGISSIDCSNNALTELDLSGCSELRLLHCGNNAITDIELPADCSKLEIVDCANNQLEELVFPADALALENVECPNNKLTRLEFPENLTTLWYLNCDNNQLTELELPDDLSALEMLGISHNDISSIDLSTATNLAMLMAHNTKLSTLDVSGMQNLYALTCDNTDISALDLSNAKGMSGMIIILSFENTNVSDLNLPSTVPVAIFNGDNARLMFSDLPDPAVMESTGSSLPDGFIDSMLESLGPEAGISVSKNFEYAPQAKVEIPDEIDSGEEIDLSSEYEVYGENTVYKWFDGTTEVTPTTSEGGKFTFGNEFADKKLRCEMTNALYPDLTLETTEVLINGPETGALTISTEVIGEDAPANAEFSYTVTFDSTESYTYTGSASGTVKSGDKITLKDGQSITIANIVVGVKFTVTQDEAEDFTTSPASRKIEGAISTTPSVAAFSNTYEKPAVDQPVTTGNLTITNKVTGTGADQTLKFSFKVEFASEDSYELRIYGAGETVPASGSTGMLGRLSVSAAGARASTGTIKSGDTIQLAHGETAVIYGLPAGTTYKVAETEVKGYKLTSTGASGTVAQDGVKAAFINEKVSTGSGSDSGSEGPKTGDYSSDNGTAVVMLQVALLASLICAFCIRKLRREETSELA